MECSLTKRRTRLSLTNFNKFKVQSHPQTVKAVKNQTGAQKRNWFADGLSHRQLRARNWVSGHESGHHWRILSYGGRCVGYFQLDPKYLGKKNGHVNLDHKHQVKVADTYAKNRYGSWVHAKHFWRIHHWY